MLNPRAAAICIFLLASICSHSQFELFEHPLEEHNGLSFLDFYSSYGFYNYADEVVEMQNIKDYEKIISKKKIKIIKVDTYWSEFKTPQTRFCHFDREGRYLLNTDSSTASDTARRIEKCYYREGKLVAIRQKLSSTYYDSNSHDYEYTFGFDEKSGFLSKLVQQDLLAKTKTATGYYYDDESRLARMEYEDSAKKTVVKYLYKDTVVHILVNDTLSPARWIVDEKNNRIKSYSDSRGGGFGIEYSGNGVDYSDFHGNIKRQYATADGCVKFIFWSNYSKGNYVFHIREIEYDRNGLILQYSTTDFYEGRKSSMVTQIFSYLHY